MGIEIENERKFVLKQNPKKILADIVKQGADVFDIRQGYLGPAARIREQTRIGLDGKPMEDPVHGFTYKANEGIQKIEIPADLTPDEFARLWKVTICSLSKRRFKVADRETDLIWEIDFFRNRLGTADLIMAEVELPDGYAGKIQKPEWLDRHILSEVEPGDRRYNNRRLADTAHRAEMLLKLGFIGGREHKRFQRLPVTAMEKPSITQDRD